MSVRGGVCKERFYGFYYFLEMQAANLMLEVRSREDDLVAAKKRCESLEKYVEEILAQNEQFRLQVRYIFSCLIPNVLKVSVLFISLALLLFCLMIYFLGNKPEQ